MEDFIHENKEALSVPLITDPKNSVSIAPQMKAADVEKEAIKNKEYNDNILNLSARYTAIEPTQGILVRVYAKVPAKSESGLYIDQPVKVPIMTHNGKGIQGYATSPYSVTDRAVVVSTPQYDTGFKKGDIVQLADIPVYAPLPGDSTVIPKFAYKHPDAVSDTIPRNVEDEHYGYYLVPSAMIIAFIDKQARD